MIPTLAGGLGGVPPRGGKPLDGMNVFDMLSNGSPSPRTEILHLLDPLGNAVSPFTMSNIAGCGGKTSSATHPPGQCEESIAIRVGDYKLIVGMFARCGRDPNATSPDDIVQRMCGWWVPKGEPGNDQRTQEIAEAAARNANVSLHYRAETPTGSPPPVSAQRPPPLRL
jgi:hypothetical protein